MNTRLFLSLTIAAALLSGCGGDDAPVDGGPDTDAMMPEDAAVPTDAAPDSGTDADVMLPDAGTDAGMMMDDGGTDGGPDAGCTSNAQCQNGDLCDGEETCEAGGCVPATTPLTCDDGEDCTTDSCAPATGCVFTPIDVDGDGDGACTDCDDADATRSSIAPELCDGIDNNCNVSIDEGAVITHYSDCDGDTWADIVAVTQDSCGAPPIDETGCGTATQAWTTRVPSEFLFDCADDDALVNSSIATFQTTPMSSVVYFYPYDYDCDMLEEQQYPTLGSCTPAGAACTTVTGWDGAVAACGESGDFITGCTAACAPMTTPRTQGCR